MAKQIINIGHANKGDGDKLRDAFVKVNANFDELYATDTATTYHLGDDVQFVDIDPDSGTVVIQSGYNTSMPIYIKGANCADGGTGGNVVIEAGGPPLGDLITGTVGDIEMAANQTTIDSNGNTWIFGADGTSTFPYGTLGGSEMSTGFRLNSDGSDAIIASGNFVGLEVSGGYGQINLIQDTETNKGRVEIFFQNSIPGALWVFDEYDNNLKLPVGGDILDSDGNSVLGVAAIRNELVNGSYNFTLGVDGTINFDPSTNGKGVLQTTADLQFIANNKTWTFGTDGNLTLPDGQSIGSGSLDGIKMTTDRGTVLFGNSPECVPTLLRHFHIMKEDASAVDLFLGDDNNYVKLPGDGETAYGVEIGTNGPGGANTWRFGTDGKLTLPGVPNPNFFHDNGTVSYYPSSWMEMLSVGISIGMGVFPNVRAAFRFNKTLYEFDFTQIKIGDPIAIDNVVAGYPVEPGTSSYQTVVTYSQQDPDNPDLWIIGQNAYGGIAAEGTSVWLKYEEENIVLNEAWGFASSRLNMPLNAKLLSGSSEWTFGTDGVLTLPVSGIIKNSDGSTYGAVTSSNVTSALGFTPYNATNPNGYISGINSSAVTSALGFTPYNATNPNGYISGINSSAVTSALGFTPYNATNPNGYISSTASLVNGLYTAALDSSGNFTIPGNLTVSGTQTYIQGTNTVYTDNLLELHAPTAGIGGAWTSSDGKDIGIRMHYYSGSDKNAALVLAQDTGYLEWYSVGTETNGVFSGTYGTAKLGGIIFAGDSSSQSTAWNSSASVTSNQITTGLGFTPYNATNPSGYITNSSLSVVTNSANGTGSLSYNAGTFTYTPPNLSSYLTSVTSSAVTSALGFTPYNATNPNNYISGITSSNVTSALGFTPYNATNPNNYISGITSSNVTSALGFTPYNATNPNNYLTSITSGQVTSALGFTPYNATNPNNYISGITSSEVTTALGFTPIQANSLSVTTAAASGSGSLSYVNGVFTFTPPSIPSMGDAIKTFLATPSSANLVAAVTDETGTGNLVFGNNPQITTGITTDSTTFNLLDSVATTINFGRAATAITLGNSSGTGTTTVQNNLAINGGLTRSSNFSGAAWGLNGIGMNMQGVTFTDTTSTGTVATQAAYAFNTPTIAATNATTYTNSYTLYVGGSPTSGTNVTQTNGYAAYFGGSVNITGSLISSSTVSLTGSSSSNVVIGSSIATGTITIGATSGTGTIGIAPTTASQTVQLGYGATAATSTLAINIGTGAAVSGGIKNINIGTAGLSGSTTNISIGSAVSGALGATTVNNILVQSVNSAVAAAGNAVQATATALVKNINFLTTVTSGSATGVQLPAGVAGMIIYVYNTTVTAANVYPVSGGTAQINALGANVAYSLAGGAGIRFMCSSATQWYTM